MSTSEPEPGPGARAVSASGQGIAAADFLRVWWQVAILSFGGPAAQIAVMQRLVVDDRGWLSQHQFNHALSFCLLLPGPEAQQLAIYIGWSLKGVHGAFLAGVLFVLPGALIMLGLSLVYGYCRSCCCCCCSVRIRSGRSWPDSSAWSLC